MTRTRSTGWAVATASIAAVVVLAYGCSPATQGGTIGATGDNASQVYVAPGNHDEFYAFLSGGFNGQRRWYGLPSGRTLKIIPVFSQHPENGWGYSEETKPMLETTFGFVPWDDLHHTGSVADGWRGGRTLAVHQWQQYASRRAHGSHAHGNHRDPADPELRRQPRITLHTGDSEYVARATRFSVPIPTGRRAHHSYKENFKGTVSFIRADKPGQMDIAFQLLVPGFNYDLARAGKGPSVDWVFFTSYNTEEAYRSSKSTRRRTTRTTSRP